MLRISGKEAGPSEEISGHFIYHPDSAALESRVREITHEELLKFGLDVDDAHQIHNDFDFVREIRTEKKAEGKADKRQFRNVVIKTVTVALLSIIGSILLVGVLFGLGHDIGGSK